jgi:hypothetical protein
MHSSPPGGGEPNAVPTLVRATNDESGRASTDVPTSKVEVDFSFTHIIYIKTTLIVNKIP